MQKWKGCKIPKEMTLMNVRKYNWRKWLLWMQESKIEKWLLRMQESKIEGNDSYECKKVKLKKMTLKNARK